MATPVIMPKLGLTMEFGVLVAWRKQEGEAVSQGEVIAEIQTDKIAHEVEAPANGTVLKLLAQPNDEVKVQVPIAVIGSPGEDVAEFLTAAPVASASSPVAQSAQGAPSAPAPSAPDVESLRITPRAKKFMQEKGVSAAELVSLGKSRITEDDVRDHLERCAKQPALMADEVVPLTPAQKIIAQRMTQSFRDIPQFSLRFNVRMDRARAAQKALAEKLGRKASINDVILRAVAVAIARVPGVQAQYTDKGLRRPKSVNLGVAVAGPGGLIVPVIPDAANKSLAEINALAAGLVEKARANRLRPDDVTGGTFTVSNLGMFGVTSFVPIVNPGESAILGVGAVQDVPVAENGMLGIRPMVEMTLVGDHRAFDGVTGAEFCKTLKLIL